MRRNILFRLLGVIVTLFGFMPLQAQDNDQYAVFNYRNDGHFNAFLNFEIDSITYSCIDTLGVEHDEVVVQEVWTSDSVYRIPLNAIDSLAFHAPAPKMRDDLFYLRDYHADCAISIDSLTLYFTPIIHSDSLPAIGQVVLSVTEKSPFEEGFAGRVVEINRLDDRIQVVCMQVTPCDVFERLVIVGMGASDTEGFENMVNARRASDGDDGGGGGTVWDKYDLEKIKLPDWLKDEWKIEFLDLVSITSKNPEVYYKYYANIDDWTFDIGGDMFVYHPDLTYKITFDWDKISKLGDEYKEIKEIWNLLKDGDFESVVAKDKEKQLEKKQWEKKLPIPFNIGPFSCVFELGVMMKPEAFDIKAEWEMKTTAIHHIGYSTKGYNASYIMSQISSVYVLVDDLFDITEVDKSFDWIQECKSTKLDAKIDGSLTFGAFLRLKANLLTKYLVRTCVSAETGLKLSYNGQINIKETDYNTTRAYGLLKDTNIGGKVYVKVKGEAGALPFDLINLSEETEIPLIEGKFYFVPHFTKPELTSQLGSKRMGNEMFTTTVSKTLFPFISCYPGLGIYSKGLSDDWDIVEALYYDDEPYKATWGSLVQNLYPDGKPDRDIQFSVFDIGLKEGETYRCYPVFRMFGFTWRGEPYTEFTYPKALSLERPSLVLRKDETCLVRVNGGWGTYELICEQEDDVVKAVFTMSGNYYQLRITALKKGTATLKVRDRRTLETETIEVKVFEGPEDGTDITVSQEDLDFGTLAYGEELTIPLKITNHGSNTLYYNIPYGAPAGFTLGNQPAITVLEPGESWTYQITATGTSPDHMRTGTIYVFSNATKDPVPIVLKVKGKATSVNYVDLGLPSGTKWAECNLGALEMIDGLNRYFAWGERDSKTSYGWDNYKYCEGTAASCEQLGEIGGTDYDAAHYQWGDKWRLPDPYEMGELVRECKWEWDNSLAFIGGPVGYQVIGPNGQHIFLEAYGVCDDTEIDGENIRGVYLTGSPGVLNSTAIVLQFEKGSYRTDEVPRYMGVSIRPVYDENMQTGALKLEPSSIDFGEVEVGKSASQTFTLTNAGTGALTVTIDDSESDVFSVKDSKEPLSLSAGESRTLTVTYTPKEEKATVGTITFRNDVNSEELKLGLLGKGIPSTGGQTPAGLEAVDLGLPSGTKWANMNVGATQPWEYGGYYAWGETEEKDWYGDYEYIHCDGSWETCHDLGSDIAGTEYDVAHVKWGGNWQMPTLDQIKELLDNTTSEWTTVNGVNGRKFTASNGNSIFLPAAWDRFYWHQPVSNVEGYYWISSQRSYYSNSNLAYCFTFNSDNAYWNYVSRFGGRSVRPVYSAPVVHEIVLSQTEVMIEPDKNCTVSIISGSGNFTAISSNSSVATAKIDGAKVVITAVAEGSTMITVTDSNSGQTGTITVKVAKSSNTPLGLEAVDLGLPSGTLWANMNVGAESPEDMGGFYAWGETEEKYVYEWSTYIHCDGTKDTCHDLGTDIAGTEYDVAHVKWGGDWQMPTSDQILELLDNTTMKSYTKNGMWGLLFTATNGNSIFLPQGGVRFGSSIGNFGYGYYWSSYPYGSRDAYNLGFQALDTWYEHWDRYRGCSVRPVMKGVPVVKDLVLSSTSVNAQVGQVCTVEVTSGSGYYIARSSDTNVATVTIEGSTITITGISEGTATITVKDQGSGQKVQIEVTVSQSGGHTPAGLEAIDLGLPSGTLWANMNVGATAPEEEGDYFAWGETIAKKKAYSWETYAHCDGDRDSCRDLAEEIAGTEYDAASMNWGHDWQMPSFDQIEELLEHCTNEWTTHNGKKGLKFTGSNGNSIFLPAGGYRWGDSLFGADENGGYWSSTQGPSYSVSAYRLYFNSSYADWNDYGRANGQSVRPVYSR